MMKKGMNTHFLKHYQHYPCKSTYGQSKEINKTKPNTEDNLPF